MEAIFSSPDAGAAAPDCARAGIDTAPARAIVSAIPLIQHAGALFDASSELDVVVSFSIGVLDEFCVN